MTFASIQKSVYSSQGNYFYHFSQKFYFSNFIDFSFKYSALVLNSCNSFIENNCHSFIFLFQSRYSYRITSRRFIQELFMDLHYDALYIEPYQLLGIDLAESVVTPDVKEISISTSLSNRGLAKVTEALTEDVLSSAASSPFN